MNNTAVMGNVHEIIKTAIEREQARGKTESEIAAQCHVSQPTVHKYLHATPTPTLDILKRFADGLRIPMSALLAAEGLAPYGKPRSESAPEIPPHLQRLLTLVNDLDRDEIATLERCAEAFKTEEPEVRQHLIGQLKIIERLVNPNQAPPAKEKKRNTSPS